jgi:hypothetical protein
MKKDVHVYHKVHMNDIYTNNKNSNQFFFQFPDSFRHCYFINFECLQRKTVVNTIL